MRDTGTSLLPAGYPIKQPSTLNLNMQVHHTFQSQNGYPTVLRVWMTFLNEVDPVE